MSDSWTGVFPAVTTKFKDDYSLDYDGMQRHFNYQIEAGVHGMVVAGTLGENGSLTSEEKQEVLKLAVSVCDGRVPVLAGIAENTTHAACKVVEAAAKNGANGFMLLPAMLYAADRRETLTHFRTVARVSDLPIMIYNNPPVYKVDVTPEMFADLADEPAFVAIKESSDDVRRITDIYNAVGNRYQIFTGVDNLALESIILGAASWPGPEEPKRHERCIVGSCLFFISTYRTSSFRISNWRKPLKVLVRRPCDHRVLFCTTKSESASSESLNRPFPNVLI